MSVRVLVVDDHPVVREGLMSVLHDRSELAIVGGAGSLAEARACLARLEVDVVLLDLDLGSESGLDLLAQLGSARALVFTAYQTDEQVFGALQAGAQGYLLKGAPLDEIVAAILEVHQGGTHLAPALASRVVQRLRSRQPLGLSPRQLEVLRMVAQGRSNAQIAAALQLTERTVKFHVTGLFNRLGADNRAQAVALASQQGLI